MEKPPPPPPPSTPSPAWPCAPSLPAALSHSTLWKEQIQQWKCWQIGRELVDRATPPTPSALGGQSCTGGSISAAAGERRVISGPYDLKISSGRRPHSICGSFGAARALRVAHISRGQRCEMPRPHWNLYWLSRHESQSVSPSSEWGRGGQTWQEIRASLVPFRTWLFFFFSPINPPPVDCQRFKPVRRLRFNRCHERNSCQQTASEHCSHNSKVWLSRLQSLKRPRLFSTRRRCVNFPTTHRAD